MSFIELVQSDGPWAFFILLAILIVAALLYAMMNRITEVKKVKYQSFSDAAGFDYDLYEFAYWLRDQGFLENPDNAVETYISQFSDSDSD